MATVLGRMAGFRIASSLILPQIPWYLLFSFKSPFLKSYSYLGKLLLEKTYSTLYMEKNVRRLKNRRQIKECTLFLQVGLWAAQLVSLVFYGFLSLSLILWCLTRCKPRLSSSHGCAFLTIFPPYRYQSLKRSLSSFYSFFHHWYFHQDPSSLDKGKGEMERYFLYATQVSEIILIKQVFKAKVTSNY